MHMAVWGDRRPRKPQAMKHALAARPAKKAGMRAICCQHVSREQGQGAHALTHS